MEDLKGLSMTSDCRTLFIESQSVRWEALRRVPRVADGGAVTLYVVKGPHKPYPTYYRAKALDELGKVGEYTLKTNRITLLSVRPFNNFQSSGWWFSTRGPSKKQTFQIFHCRCSLFQAEDDPLHLHGTATFIP